MMNINKIYFNRSKNLAQNNNKNFKITKLFKTKIL